ncbi:hypothetical protein AC249_AIPGENE17729, partial [Exaiptasia diaphana]
TTSARTNGQPDCYTPKTKKPRQWLPYSLTWTASQAKSNPTRKRSFSFR